MKQKLKKIGLILLIILAILLCLVFVGFAYLFLVPNSSLFGIEYITVKNSQMYHLGEYTDYSLKEIKLNTGKYSVNVVVDDSYEEVLVYMKNDVSGLVLKKNSNIGLNHVYDSINRKLTINTDEASGWVGFGKSYIQLIIPKTILSSDFALSVGVRAKSSVDINGAKDIKIKSLSVLAYRGGINIDNLDVSNLSVYTSKSKVILGANVGPYIDKVLLDIGDAEVSFLKAGGGDVEIKNGTRDKTKVNFNIGNLEIANVGEHGYIQLFQCEEMSSSGAGVKRLSGGEIECLYINSALQMYTNDCDLYVYEISGVYKSIYNSNGDGQFILAGKTNGGLDIVTNKGSIDVNEITDVSTFQSGTGSINIKNATKALQIISNSGTVNVKFKDDCGEYTGDENGFRKLSLLRVKNSKVTIRGLNNIGLLEVEDGGRADIKLFYQKVILTNTIKSKTATLLCVVPEDESVYLKVEGTGAKLKCDVGTATREMSALDSTYEKEVYGLSNNNILDIKTSGVVTLYSDNIYGI